MPELKSFIKTDAEVLQYENIEVKFVPGRKAILTIYDDGIEKEKITLSNYKSKSEMHKLMLDKGFVKKSIEEITEIQRKAKEAADEEKRKYDERMQRIRERQENRPKRPTFQGISSSSNSNLLSGDPNNIVRNNVNEITGAKTTSSTSTTTSSAIPNNNNKYVRGSVQKSEEVKQQQKQREILAKEKLSTIDGYNIPESITNYYEMMSSSSDMSSTTFGLPSNQVIITLAGLLGLMGIVFRKRILLLCCNKKDAAHTK